MTLQPAEALVQKAPANRFILGLACVSDYNQNLG